MIRGKFSTADDLHKKLFAIGSRGGGAYPEPGDLFEQLIENIYKAILKLGDVALDGGAHVGRHTWPMAERVGAAGKVLAVEAHSKIARGLVKRVRKRRLCNVEVIAKALTDRPGRIGFHCVKEHPAYSGIARRRYDFPDHVREMEVEAITIDDLVAHRTALRFCKLDLEGGELRALEGARRVLREQRPFLVFENGQEDSARDYGYSREDWFGFFESVGYAVFALWGNPYAPADWGRKDIPWYFLGVASGSDDERFVGEKLPAIVAALE